MITILTHYNGSGLNNPPSCMSDSNLKASGLEELIIIIIIVFSHIVYVCV
jgi:hypothetical protein